MKPTERVNSMRKKIALSGFWFWVSLVLVCLLGVQGYLSYRFPIKQDLYGHPFRTNQVNRLVAYAFLMRSDRKFARYDADQINAMIDASARESGVDPLLVKSITLYESYYLSTAISTTGAMGLMALMPETVRRQGVRDPFNPAENIAAGARQIRMLSDAFQGDPPLILAGYNAGKSNVQKYHGVPPFPETEAYVSNVMRIYKYFNEIAYLSKN